MSFSHFLTAQSSYSIQSISPELLVGANSVVLEDSQTIDLSNSQKMRWHTRRVYAVLNELGHRHVRRTIGYNDYTKVRSAEANIYDVKGKRIKRYRQRDFFDKHAVDNVSLYMDDRLMYFNYTPASYPYFIAIDFEIETSDTAFLPIWFPINNYAQGVLESHIEIKYDKDNKPKFEANNLEAFDIESEDTGAKLTFKAKNLPPVGYEELALSFNQIFPNVRFALDDFYIKGVPGIAMDWASFGSWMDKTLLQDESSLHPATIARVKSLAAEESTNEGKARKVYQFVQDKVRYISVQIGIGGWQPMPVSEVDKLSYGDCKALTHYTKTLLDIVGVPSYYTVIHAGANGTDISSEFASFQGNHVILAIPNEDEITWLECTSQDTPYGFIGDFTDDRDALMITPEGGEIVRTKVYDASESLQYSRIVASLDEKGNLNVDLSRDSQGLEYHPQYLLPKRTSEEIEEYYKRSWGYINGLKIDKVQHIDNREEIIFTENLNLSVPQYATAIGNDMFFTVNILNQSQYVPPRILNRTQDLSISKSYTHRDIVEIDISDKYSISALPEEEIIQSEFGSYSISFSKISETRLQYQRELIINKGVYPKEFYSDYREFRRNIVKSDQAKILLTNVDL